MCFPFVPSVYLASCLKSPKRRRALKKLRGRRIAELLPLGSTLQLLAGLQTDGNHKVAQAAANCLCRAAGCKAFRAKVQQGKEYYQSSHRTLRSTMIYLHVHSLRWTPDDFCATNLLGYSTLDPDQSCSCI